MRKWQSRRRFKEGLDKAKEVTIGGSVMKKIVNKRHNNMIHEAFQQILVHVGEEASRKQVMVSFESEHEDQKNDGYFRNRADERTSQNDSR